MCPEDNPSTDPPPDRETVATLAVSVDLLRIRKAPPNCAESSLQCHLHLLVPQGVDERIEHGCHHRIEEGNKFALVLGAAAGWLQVHEDDSAIEDDHHQQVG